MAAESDTQVTAAPSVRRVAVIAAFNEADRIGATIGTLKHTFPGIQIFVGDDGSQDETVEIARRAGATIHGRDKSIGKGGNATGPAEAGLWCLAGDQAPYKPTGTVLLCDADLGTSAANLVPLVEAVEAGECDLAIAGFAVKAGGGFGLAKGFARWAIRRRSGFVADSPISGQRAMKAEVLEAVLPFASAFGMEIGMTVDAVRAGHRVIEIELPLEHRATGRTISGFAHRGRQLRDFARVYVEKRKRKPKLDVS